VNNVSKINMRFAVPHFLKQLRKYYEDKYPLIKFKKNFKKSLRSIFTPKIILYA